MPRHSGGQNGVVSGRVCRRIRRQKRQSEDSAFIIPLFIQRCKENSAADDGYFGGFPTRAAVACKSGKASVPVYTANRHGSHRPPRSPDTLRRLSGMDSRRGKKTQVCSLSMRRCRAVKIRLPRKRFSARRQNGGKSQKPLPFCSDSAGYSGGTKTAAAVRGLPDAGIALRRFSPIRPSRKIRSSAAPR